MAATGQDFAATLGDTVLLDYTFTEADGTPLNLTSATVVWQLSWGPASLPLVVKSSSAAAGIAVINAAAGKVEVTLATTDTAALTPGRYYHEAKVIDALGDVTTVAIGAATLTAGLAVPS
jgi:hypothetical protein